MTTAQMLITVFAAGAATVLTRAIAFIAFPPGRETPRHISYLGHALPGAVFGLLVVYCLRNITLMESPFGIPEIISCLLVVVLQKWKRSSLVSILAGTICYMVLIRVLF